MIISDDEYIKLLWENRKMRDTLEEISKTPITRGISLVEQRLSFIVDKAQGVLNNIKLGE